MAFGNPYDDVYNESIVYEWVEQITALGVTSISLADTIGMATSKQVHDITKYVIKSFPGIEIGIHLHSAPPNREEKLDAALTAGCRIFDSAIKGIGGCPMAGNDLVGNIDTEIMINNFRDAGFNMDINFEQLTICSNLASEIFV